jgi:hypothetical protein
MIDIKTFREAYNLPAAFGVAHFEPKDFTGLAQIDRAGDALQQLRTAVVAAIPAALTVTELPGVFDHLAQVFRQTLKRINPQVNLKQVEIDYAVDGFEAVNGMVMFALIRAHASSATAPDFDAIYRQWVTESERISARVHLYDDWRVQIINDAYGRAGLLVHLDDETTVRVRDATLACPAAGFMYGVMKTVAEYVIIALDNK